MSWCEAHMVFEGEVGCLCDAEMESGFISYDPDAAADDEEDMADPRCGDYDLYYCGSDDGDPYGEDGRA